MVTHLIKKDLARRLTKNPMRLTLYIVIILVIVSIFFIIKHSKDHAPLPASALTITSVTAVQTKWPKTLEASGSITAWQEAIIGSEISGQHLIEVLVNVGDVVKKGQVLARYNTDRLLAEKAELQANWIQAESDRKRTESLKKTGAMSIQQIESYVNKAAVAKARLDAKNVELHYAAVIAPDEGVISSRTATLGAVGSLGSELFRMILHNKYEWHGELTAQQLALIVPGQLVKLTLPDGSLAQAVIRQIAPSFNANSRMALVYADIAPNPHVHAGMYANGVIEMGLSTLVSVPAESVIIHDGYSYIYKLAGGFPLKVKQQRVTVGRQRGNQVEIIAGLHSGERLVAKGAGFLNDGDSVYVANDVENNA